MAPDGDFIDAASQDASYYFMNVAPQWQCFNGANWKSVKILYSILYSLFNSLFIIHYLISLFNSLFIINYSIHYSLFNSLFIIHYSIHFSLFNSLFDSLLVIQFIIRFVIHYSLSTSLFNSLFHSLFIIHCPIHYSIFILNEGVCVGKRIDWPIVCTDCGQRCLRFGAERIECERIGAAAGSGVRPSRSELPLAASAGRRNHRHRLFKSTQTSSTFSPFFPNSLFIIRYSILIHFH